MTYSYTVGLEKFCKPSGFIPQKLINSFKEKYSSVIIETETLEEKYKTIPNISNKLENIKKWEEQELFSSYDVMKALALKTGRKKYSLKDYCKALNNMTILK